MNNGSGIAALTGIGIGELFLRNFIGAFAVGLGFMAFYWLYSFAVSKSKLEKGKKKKGKKKGKKQ